MRAFKYYLDRLVDWAMIVAEVAITLMMAHIALELFSRWFVRYSLDAVPETVAFYYMTALTFFALAYVTRANGHIAAEIFTDLLPPRGREVLLGIIAVFLCIFMVLLTWQSVQEAITMTAIAEVHQGARTYLPKWPGRWFLAAGSAIMAVYAAVIAIQKLTGEPEADAAKPAGRD